MSKDKFLVNSPFIMKGCLVLVFIFLFFISSSLSWADDAMVLPKNRWRSYLDFNIYPSWTKEYNDKGQEEDLAFDYNRELDKQVISDLAAFGDYPASFGQSIVDFEKESVITNVSLSYGITDNLSLGLKIPYWKFTTTVQTDLDKSSATVAKNPNLANDPTHPLVPTPVIANILSNPPYNLDEENVEAQIKALKLTREDILNLLGDGIPELGLPGYGYKKLETWSDSGLGDIEMALKYKYFQNTYWRLGLQGGVRFPTGQEDDPDNLVDYGFGGGNYDLSLGFQNDYIGFKNFVLNGSIRYINQLPDKATLRTPEDVDQPLTAQKDRVDRDQGDIWEMEFSAMYSLPLGFGLSATYGASFKDKDSVEGDDGRIASLEDKTDQTGHTLLIGVSYNNLSRFQQKQASVPFQASMGYWNRFDGENMNKASYYSVRGSVFF